MENYHLYGQKEEQMDWKDKTAVITGASSGIGRALALNLSGKGASLVLAARNQPALEALASGLPGGSSRVRCVKTDVSIEAECVSLIEEAARFSGDIDVLINNAGISMRALFGEVDLKVLHELMNVNFWGSVYCTRHALPFLLQAKGSVVGVSSVAGYKGLPGRSGYSASKFALQGFLETVRIEYSKQGLHVLIACPGFTASNIRLTARGRDGRPQQESPLDEHKLMSAEMVAERIVRAIEKRKRSMVLTTQGKLTVNLNKFFPGLVDRLVYRHMAKEPDSPFK
ncbi:MAG TPA: SDR family oxidoreductase [Bacteroidales bacterium]|nr:SDR family oxidoreductase [Bacteroidales bacterium]HSA42593.1 SDR family oxidoreductase [Bacteroidales bacterium]